MKRKIKIVKAPTYKYGGHTGDQQNYGLYRGGGNLHDYLTGTELSDQQDVRVTYPEVPREQANIEVEKGEYIVPSDMSALYKVGGKKHSKGGTPVFAQGGEYVISDYITMPGFLQEIFGFEGKSNRKKDNTIAALLGDKVDAKDYNRLSKLIQDDANGKEVDQYALATARNRMPKYQEYVSKAALGGELSKAVQGKDFEIPEIGMPALSNLQEMSREEETQMEPLAKVRIGGRLPEYQGDQGPGTVRDGRRARALSRAKKAKELENANITPIVVTGTPVVNQNLVSNAPITDIPDWFLKSIFDEAKTEWGGRSATTGKSTVFDYSDPNRMYSDYKYWRDRAAREFTGPEDFQKFVFGQIELEDPGYFQNIMTEWGMPTAGTLTDKLFGARTAAAMQWRPPGTNVKPVREVPGGTPNNGVIPGGTPGGGTKVKVTGQTDPLNYVTNRQSGKFPWWTENVLQTGLLAGDLYNKEDIYPWEPAINFTYPQAVFRSPRQAIAAVQSQAAELSRNAAMLADPQRQRAVTMDIQSRTIPGIIQAEEQINAQNQAAANQLDLARSEISNRLAMSRAESALRLKDKGTILRAQSRKEDRDKMAALLEKGIIPGRKEATRTGWINMLNPYFNVDPRTGTINFTEKGKGTKDDAMSMSGLGMNQAQAQALAQLASQFVPALGQAGAAEVIKAIISSQRPTSGKSMQEQLLNYLKEYGG